MVRAVILDMDGLMLDTEAISRRVWGQAAVEMGIRLTDAIAREMVGRPEASTREMLREHFGDAAPAFVAHAQARYREALETGGVPAKPGLDALLAWLTRERIPCAVATSTARALAEYKLARAGIRSKFGVVVCGDEVARGKPAPDIFLRTAEALGQEPRACIVLEDSGPGILAATAAGMRTILIPDACEPSAEVRRAASATVDSLSAALVLLERVHSGGSDLAMTSPDD